MVHVGGKGVKGQPGVQRRLGREAAGACVPGWRCGGERSRHQVAPSASHALPHGACEALWGQRGCACSRGELRRLGRVCRPTG
eukprot:65606-Rhodomonas_salina.1